MTNLSHGRSLLWSLLFTILHVSAGTADAQIDTRTLIEEVFQAGLNSFRQGRYGEALSSFEVVIAGPTRNHRTTAAYIMTAKAGFRTGNYPRVRLRTSELLERYPRTSYADQALYLRALSEYRLGDFDIAASDLIRLSEVHPASPLAGRSEALLDDILSSHLPVSELRRLSNLKLPRALAVRVGFALAKSLAGEGKDTLALRTLDALLEGPLPDSVRISIAGLKEDIAGGEKIQIGVLLPLMEGVPGGDVRRIADEVLDGIRFAADEYNVSVNPGRQVELRIGDTWYIDSVAGEQSAKWGSVEGVRAIVGPLFTDEFTAAALAANKRYLPIISPTATGDAIAELGPYIFQANPDYATRGRASARYAVENLGMSSFAILASDDFVGKSHAAAFREEAERLGATVYCTAYFPPESEDLREPYMKIRRSVMAEGTLVRISDLMKPEHLLKLREHGEDPASFADDPSLFDSVRGAFVSVPTLFGPRGYAIAESLGLPIAVYDTTADETDIPLVALDALFIALGDPRQMDYVAPQLNYFNIKAQVIGNNEWYDPDRLRENGRYIDGAMILSDSYIDPADSSIARFASAFRIRWGRNPTKFTYYGYDTMGLLLDQLREGARSRVEIGRGLSAVNAYNGLHSVISLTGGRVNADLHVLQITDGRVIRFGEASGRR